MLPFTPPLLMYFGQVATAGFLCNTGHVTAMLAATPTLSPCWFVEPTLRLPAFCSMLLSLVVCYHIHVVLLPISSAAPGAIAPMLSSQTLFAQGCCCDARRGSTPGPDTCYVCVLSQLLLRRI